jgi:hypothetical protein
LLPKIGVLGRVAVSFIRIPDAGRAEKAEGLGEPAAQPGVLVEEVAVTAVDGF